MPAIETLVFTLCEYIRRSSIDLNPPKARLPGKGESQPAVGEGGRQFEPARVRDDLVLRPRWAPLIPEPFCRIAGGRI
jgi:hypothetical protein